MTYWWVETDMIDQINKDGFKILKNGKIEVDCLLYTSHATEPDPGVECKATLSLNEDGSGMKLENLETCLKNAFWQSDYYYSQRSLRCYANWKLSNSTH